MFMKNDFSEMKKLVRKEAMVTVLQIPGWPNG